MTSKVPYAICSALIAMITSIPAAQANVVCPAFGNAVPFTNQNCWFQNKCSMTNQCTARQSIDIPIVIQRSGRHTILVWGTAPRLGVALEC